MPDTRQKIDKFKDYIYNLQFINKFKCSKFSIDKQDITEIKSHDHVILQCMDIILGAMQFRLNDMHKEKPEGQVRRGKKTIAKEKLYKHIYNQICDIHPYFNTGDSTGRRGNEENVWLHPYRHWKFIPREHEIDETKVKNK